MTKATKIRAKFKKEYVVNLLEYLKQLVQSNFNEIVLGNKSKKRQEPLFWIRPPDRPGLFGKNDPDLAMRKGDYKFMMDINGSNPQLYDLTKDASETYNLINEFPLTYKNFEEELMRWYSNYPQDIDVSLYEKSL